MTRLQVRIAGLDWLTRDIDAAVARRRDTRGEAFAMRVDGVAHRKRTEVGQHLKRVLWTGRARSARTSGATRCGSDSWAGSR